MSTTFGIIPEGFNEKQLNTILEEIETAQREAFGAAFNTSPDSAAGQINGIFADQVAELWEVQLAVFRALSRAGASGEALDTIGDLTGAIRLAAAPSTVTLQLNLDAAASVPIGSVVSVGTNGARFETTAVVTNSLGFEATLPVTAKSENDGPIAGNAFSINTIVTPVAGWGGNAAINTQGSEPFHLTNGQVLGIGIDDVADNEVFLPVLVTFSSGDFGDIANATAAEVAAVITAVSGITAVDAGGEVRISSDTTTSDSALRIDGNGAVPLGLSNGKYESFNPSTRAQITNTISDTYALVDGQTLFVRIDGGGTQTATFNTADFVAIGAATAEEVAIVINADISGAHAFVVNDRVRIESKTFGNNSLIEITGGTANAALIFTESDIQGGTSGDADLGNLVETDASFRIRQLELLSLAGAGTLPSIRSAVRAIAGITGVSAFENASDIVDGFGRPPHSFEIVVSGPATLDTAVAQAIFDTKPAGIESFKVPGPNGVTVMITDTEGVMHDINFSRADEIDYWIDVDITIDATVFGNGDQDAGEQQVIEALKAEGDLMVIGQDIIIVRFQCSPFSVAGVVDVPAIRIDSSASPVNTANIVIADRDIAVFSTARITIGTVTFA